MNDTAKHLVESHSVAETLTLGRQLGAALSPGTVVGLIGTLGSGKTYFVKGVAEGNATPADVPVNSPTFVLVNEYPGRIHLYHVDVYRLREARELDSIGFEEMLDSDGAVLVEWADRVAEYIPTDHLEIAIEVTGETDRHFRISAGGPKSWAVLESMT
jgi:tRNA threonylcarbamoyladenosine biosynthesis protein TsaE